MFCFKIEFHFTISKPPSFSQLIAPIKKVFKNSHLTDTLKENLRHLILINVNFNSTNFKSNLTQAEKTALKELNFNKDIIITKADKGEQDYWKSV